MVGGSQQLLLKVTRKDWRRAMKGERQEERELYQGKPEGIELQLFRPAGGAAHVTHQLPPHLHDLHARRVGVKRLQLPYFSLVVPSWPSNGLVRVALRAGDAQSQQRLEGIGAKQAV